VVAGGDGTINEAAEGMAHSAVPLAILPGGTANVLAHGDEARRRSSAPPRAWRSAARGAFPSAI
jgi:diacylglycerol kinase family enzyme